MNTDSDLYKKTALVNKARKQTESYKQPYEEKYDADNFYAFARGDMLVALTNSYDNAARFGGAQMSLSSNDYSAFTQASTQSNFGA
jgi:hypothetical protein